MMIDALLAIACLVHSLPIADTTPAIAPLSTGVTACESNLIDQYVLGTLGELGIEPSALSSDTEFLRRLSLTVIGQLPKPEEIRSFVAEQRRDKRTRKIDELLNHDLHSAVWASRFCEWTGNSIESLAVDEEVAYQVGQLWHQWLRGRFARNEPYDRLVRSIITAQSRSVMSIGEWINEETAMVRAVRQRRDFTYADRATLDLFWKRTNVEDQYPVRELAERVASVFLGVRINCARCHDHPFDQWTQADYHGYVRIFEQVRHDMSPELRREFSRRLSERRRQFANGEQVGPPLPRITEVYLAPLSENDDRPAPKALGGPEFDVDTLDFRVALADWMIDEGNPFFARNVVNRVWAHYFGRGIVEPLDGLGSNNENIAYRELLDDLSKRFVASGYDVLKLELLILNSTTWQLSSIPNESNRGDDRYFSRAFVRLPTAETFVDMWHAATGIEPDLGNTLIRGLHAVEIGPDRLPKDRWDGVLKLFGQPDREETCDCSPRGRPGIRQTLALMSDPLLIADISRGRLAKLRTDDLTHDQTVDELFLSTLSRWPTGDERAAVRRASARSEKCDSWEGILWSLLNTQEFITIH